MSEEKEKQAEAASPFLEEKAFKSRTVLVFGTINDKLAAEVSKRLIALSAESNEPITLLVSSPGGHVESGDVIHDMIRFINAPVRVVGTGWVGSAAVNVFLAVPKQHRVCLPNTRFLIHQPSGGAGGQATDIAIQAREIVKIRERIAALIAKESGQTLERVTSDIERDYWMTAVEARDYGLVSRIIVQQSELDA
ncbi:MULTISPECIES: ATP-dependent Clp protease proteolytic subunit [Undibacterium]|jgi:ATP-dependent Clp protease protease subunit|uniref:ATP-dependent Clp protease proteolytic subunit n=2 Tax=Undibacterium TaxID=401469 RepID=A0A941DBK2_9BURK|nr:MULTISPECIES: ATP-dependent Clp protease proteolytic subunit [Undibacterium]MBR7745663.1 ATP-dependent Clp protease proteolytic subunit [Undibacterium baiyunense]GGX10330.1 ATP-dependent Clp protease proteolytic subunit 3 [Undibacterium macrobrachii]